MAHDFAAKPRPRKRAPSPPPAPAPTPKKRPSTLLWLLALGALGGLGYLLYQLAGVQPDPAAQQVQSGKPAASQTSSAPKPRPKPSAKPAEAPKEYDFYKLLPNSKVVAPTVEAYQSTPKSVENHQSTLLQAGSFRNPADAERMRAQLLLLGLPNVTSSEVTNSNGSTWYRVRTGPFSSRSQLNKAYDKLVQLNIQPMRVKMP